MTRVASTGRGRRRAPRIWLGAVLGATLVCLGFVLAGRGASYDRIATPAHSAGTQVTGRTPILLISIDTLRADRLSLYGNPRPTSPFLDGLAGESIVFDRFYYSGGGTLPSHMTMLTSLNPATHGIHPGSGKRLEDRRVTLAEVLKLAGYRTAAFTDGGWMSARHGFDQGFDVYDDRNRGIRESWAKASRWLRGGPIDSWFLFLHSYDVHSKEEGLPYSCPGDGELRFVEPGGPEFDGCRSGRCASHLLAWLNAEIKAGRQTPFETLDQRDADLLRTLYDGCIRYVDTELARIAAELQAIGAWDRALVVVTSDHGEEFAEHGLWLHDQGGYEELAHIPLLVKLPRGRLGGERSANLGAMVDLMPTLLDAVNLDPPPDTQGKSLLRPLHDPRGAKSAVHMYSVLRTRRFKYFSDEHRLFDLASDPREIDNLFSTRRELAAELERQVRDLVALDHAAAAAFSASVPSRQAEAPSEEELERLRALGYL